MNGKVLRQFVEKQDWRKKVKAFVDFKKDGGDGC
jgi:hypothetical protein